jgi:hypothetical protein
MDVVLLQKSRLSHQAAKASHDKRTPTEAETVNKIARFVVVYQKGVSRSNAKRQAYTGKTAYPRVEYPLGADAGFVVDDLSVALCVIMRQATYDLYDITGTVLFAVFL